MSRFRSLLKPWMLPIAMLTGVVLRDYIGGVAFLTRYFIFVMLLITYCRVSWRDFRPTPLMWRLLPIQFVGALAVWVATLPLGADIAQACFICVFCPTATAAPVVTGLLGGSVARVATYSLFSHAIAAFTAPLIFPLLSPSAAVSFATAVTAVAANVVPVILGPLAVAAALQAWAPRVHRELAQRQSLSFYIWALSLIIVVGNAVSFVLSRPPECLPEVVAMCLLSLLLCVAQFAVGRAVGRRRGEPVVGAQALGQKNTVLAIWMAMTFLHPICSVGPAAYVAWHNSYNSWQIYRHERRSR